MNRTQAITTLMVGLLVSFWTPALAQGQSESDIVIGDWNCAVEGSQNPTFFQLLEDDKAQMCGTQDGELKKDWTKGKWHFDDVDYNDDDQAVVTIKVTWNGGNPHATKTEMTVKLTLLTDDKMEVRWAEEPMRIWSRVKPDDEDDKQR